MEITNKAKQHIEYIANNQSKDTVVFSVVGGGCSGFMYDWGVNNRSEMNEDVYIFQEITEGLYLAVDDMSWQYVENCQVDYVEELTGSSLVVNNPLAVAACGCGESITF